MNELIPVQKNKYGDVVVSGRDLHEFLENNERYSKWFDRIVKYGFVEKIDYTTVPKSTVVGNGASKVIIDHALTLDMAKEISMIQRNEKGKRARQYFI